MAQLNTIGERIAYLRTKHKLTQKEVMEALNFDNLSRYENNERKPSISVIIALAEYFKVSTDWILLGKCRNPGRCWGDDKDLERFITLFKELSDLEKGMIIGRMETMVEAKDHSPKN